MILYAAVSKKPDEFRHTTPEACTEDARSVSVRGETIVGPVPNTKLPVPVSSVTAVLKFTDDGFCKKVSTLVAKVRPEPLPEKDVAVKTPVPELNVKLEPVFGGKSPVASVQNNRLHVVSVDSSAAVTFSAVVALSTVDPVST